MEAPPEIYISVKARMVAAIATLALATTGEVTLNFDEAAHAKPANDETATEEMTPLRQLGELSLREDQLKIMTGHQPYHKHKRKHLPWILRRIGGCESAGAPTARIDYQAQNRDSTASGGYQFLDSTWNKFHGYRRAKFAPPDTQDKKAKQTLSKEGTSPWASSRSCWE